MKGSCLVFLFLCTGFVRGWQQVWPAGTAQKAGQNVMYSGRPSTTAVKQMRTPSLVMPALAYANAGQAISASIAQQQMTVLVQMLRGLGLNTLASFIPHADLHDLFAQAGAPKTLLAPSDDAFSLIPSPLMARLQTDSVRLGKLLRYHVIPGLIPAAAIRNDLLVPSMMPDKLVRFNIYTLAGTTRVTANGALISRLNVVNNQQVILHVLDKVLFPQPRGDITTTIFTDNCTIYDGMTTALAASGLQDFFKSQGSFTLFMPTTSAFQTVPRRNLNPILSDPEKVAALLLSHTVNGTYYSQGLRDGQWLTTASRFQVPLWVGVVSEGNSRRLDSVNGQIRIVQADIPADNGVIHLIDRPINPTELLELFVCESDLL